MLTLLQGTHRAGLKPEDSVVDVNSKVWNFPNLFLGGAGNIGSNFAANRKLAPSRFQPCLTVQSLRQLL